MVYTLEVYGILLGYLTIYRDINCMDIKLDGIFIGLIMEYLSINQWNIMEYDEKIECITNST